MAGSSNLDYLYASNANVSNFVSVKLSGNHNYHLWKTQMLCLMESHDMCGIVDASFDSPRASSIKIRKQYDRLLKGWIFGSITEDVLVNVFNLKSAKDVWEKLNSIYHNPTISFQIDSAQTKPEAKKETKDKDVISEEISTKAKEEKDRKERKKKLPKDIPKKHKDAGREELNIEASARIQDFHYAKNANVSNFVSVKLSSDLKYYQLWKKQMLCLMTTHNVCDFVDVHRPKALTDKLEKQFDNLVKGWIFGSVSEDVLGAIVNLSSANDVWGKLETFYETSMSSQPEKGTKKVEEEWNNYKKDLRIATMKGRWSEVKKILEKHKGAEREAINSDGKRILHLAVEMGHVDFVKDLLLFIKEIGEKEKGDEWKKEVQEVLELRNVDKSTALHIAAIVGNLEAAKLMVKKHEGLLTIENEKGHRPLFEACSSMQYDTFLYLHDAEKKANPGDHNTETSDEKVLHSIDTATGVQLIANAISAKRYSTALLLVKLFPYLSFESDEVLMAIATTFPSEPTNVEKLIYPSSLGDMRGRIIDRTCSLFCRPCVAIDSNDLIVVSRLFKILLAVPVMMLVLVYQLIRFLILMVYLPFFLLYFLSWKVATILVAPIKHIEKKNNEWDDAKELLKVVCENIGEELEYGYHPVSYNRSFLEAATQNASRVVKEILFRSPDAITSTDESGHDIIQLAVIHRREEVYNLSQIAERKRHYRTFEDCSGNNILHLAAKLAPSCELNRRTGAALQLQGELQWREEVKKLVFPTYITKENIFKETPDMVFTREHANLVKEGEKWMKTTAESCSITAALITTIVFAAAITVPGGNNQETGIPMFTKDIAFTIFAISDAISLFTSSTSLLAFLSILTARFAEEDFLVRLPRRLIIGLCTLLLSATAMMVAFSTALFLVFCDQKPWMLAPICGLASLPIAFFFIVQFPLILDLFLSTYGGTFSKQSNSHHREIDLNDIVLRVS